MNRNLFLYIIISLCVVSSLMCGELNFLHGFNNPNGRTGQVTIKMQSIHSMWGHPNKEVFNVTLPITDYVTLEYNTLKFHTVSSTIGSDGITTEEWSSMISDAIEVSIRIEFEPGFAKNLNS